MNQNIVEFKLIYGCNLKCIFCIEGKKRGVCKMLDKNIILEYLDNLIIESKIKTIHISGGEPTLYKDLQNLLKEINKRPIDRIILHTNAINLADEEYCKNILPFITNVFISFHSALEGSHKIISGVDNKLDLQKLGIENCISSNVKVLVNTVLNKYNLCEIKSIANYLHSINVNAWMVTFPIIGGWARENKSNIIPESFEDLRKYLYPVLDEYKNKGLYIIPNGMPICYFDNYLDYIIDSYRHIDNMGFDWFNRKMIDFDSINIKDVYDDSEVKLYKAKKCNRCVFNTKCSGVNNELKNSNLWPELSIIRPSIIESN